MEVALVAVQPVVVVAVVDVGETVEARMGKEKKEHFTLYGLSEKFNSHVPVLDRVPSFYFQLKN